MSEPSSYPKPGEFSWNELISTKSVESAGFYAQLFGWKATPFVPKGSPEGAPAYTLFKTEGGDEMGVGGMAAPVHPQAPTQWVPYVVVVDADASLAKAASLGAEVILPVTSIGEVGRIAVVRDPQGAVIGLHEFPKQA